MNYVKDDKGNNVEGLSKQEIYAVLQQAIEDGDLKNIDAESAFVSKLKCCVGGETFQIAFVTQAEYNNLQAQGQLIADALYFITDDDSYNDLVDAINDLKDGNETVKSAETATNAINAILNNDNTYSGFTKDANGVLKVGDIIIPQKKLLWSGDPSLEIDISSFSNLAGKTLQIITDESTIRNGGIYNIKVTSKTIQNNNFFVGTGSGQLYYIDIQIRLDINKLKIFTLKSSYNGGNSENVSSGSLMESQIIKIYEIIE